MRKTLLAIVATLLLITNTALAQPNDLQAQQQKVNRIKSTTQGKEIMNTIDRYSKQYRVDSNLMKAIILVESGFNPNAISPDGSKGLCQMQDSSFYARKVGNNPYDITQSIHAGTKHMSGLLAKYKGREDLALAAYNCGGGCVDSHLKRYGKLPQSTLPYIYRIQNYKQFITF